jgi:hypothetical protein
MSHIKIIFLLFTTISKKLKLHMQVKKIMYSIIFKITLAFLIISRKILVAEDKIVSCLSETFALLPDYMAQQPRRQPSSFSLLFSLFDLFENYLSVTGIYAHMMRHSSDYGSCGQEKVLMLKQLDAVVVLVVVHSLVLTKMVPNFLNLVGMTFKMELIWQHLGKF